MDDVFVFTAAAPEMAPAISPYESPEEVQLADLALEEVVLAEGDSWCGPLSFFEIMADPDYAAWVRQEAALQAFVAAQTLEEKLAILAPFQDDFAVV